MTYGPYGFHASYDSEVSKLVQKFKEMSMTEHDIKNVLYGAIREMTRDRKYYYPSSYRPHFTDEGHALIKDMMDLYAEKIHIAIQEANDQRAKEMVFNQLKEDNK
jgi:hypothetical protein